MSQFSNLFKVFYYFRDRFFGKKEERIDITDNEFNPLNSP